MQKWEYKIVDAETSEEQLNKLGRDGWELAGVIAYSSDGCSTSLVFKRPFSN